MLDGLDAIEWSELAHAYGTADDVPRLLRELASDDAGVREGALWALHGNIWHQGTIYEATAPAVPFLIELAGRNGQGDRAEILALLARIASGSSYLAAHARYDDGDPDEEQLRKELAWVRAAGEAVAEGRDVYAGLSRHEDPRLRRAALVVLSCFPERAAELLADRLETEDDPAALVVALLGLADAADSPEVASLLDHEESAVRAAAHLADAAGGTLDDAGIALVCDPDVYVEFVGLLEELFAQIRRPTQYFDVLDADGRAALAERLPAALGQLTSAQPALDLARWLLESVFEEPVGQPPSADALDDSQRRVLEAIALSDAAWIFGGNMTLALGDAGLEGITSRRDLFDYLDLAEPVSVMVVRPARSPGAHRAIARLGREPWAQIPFVFFRGDVSVLDELIAEDPDDFPEEVMSDANEIAQPMYEELVAGVDRQLSRFRFYPDHTSDELAAICRAQGWTVVEPPAQPTLSARSGAPREDHDPGVCWADLDDAQRQVLDHSVERLDEAGWKEARVWHDFVCEADGFTPKPIMMARYFGEETDLELSMWFYDDHVARRDGVHEGDPYLRLQIADKTGALLVTLRLYFGERLDEVLDALVEHQASMSPDNLGEAFLVDAHEQCEQVLVDTGDELLTFREIAGM